MLLELSFSTSQRARAEDDARFGMKNNRMPWLGVAVGRLEVSNKSGFTELRQLKCVGDIGFD